jgi:phosphoglycerate-specific signal transduction histidine kinase
MKWKTNNTTLLEQFQNQIELSQKEAASILLAYIYIKLVLWVQNSFLVNDKVIQVFSTNE